MDHQFRIPRPATIARTAPPALSVNLSSGRQRRRGHAQQRQGERRPDARPSPRYVSGAEGSISAARRADQRCDEADHMLHRRRSRHRPRRPTRGSPRPIPPKALVRVKAAQGKYEHREDPQDQRLAHQLRHVARQVPETLVDRSAIRRSAHRDRAATIASGTSAAAAIAAAPSSIGQVSHQPELGNCPDSKAEAVADGEPGADRLVAALRERGAEPAADRGVVKRHRQRGDGKDRRQQRAPARAASALGRSSAGGRHRPGRLTRRAG